LHPAAYSTKLLKLCFSSALRVRKKLADDSSTKRRRT
jgi:hypothetical protein